MGKFSNSPTRFGLETCQNMFDKLKWEAHRLEDGWNVYDTFNFVVTANHLYIDWIRDCGSQEAKKKKDLLPKLAKMVMQTIIDLSNGGKHWRMTNERSLSRQVITIAPERGINDWHAYFIAGSMVYVEFDDYKLSMRQLRDLVLGYFQWVFEDEDVVFPEELQDQLEACRIRRKT